VNFFIKKVKNGNWKVLFFSPALTPGMHAFSGWLDVQVDPDTNESESRVGKRVFAVVRGTFLIWGLSEPTASDVARSDVQPSLGFVDLSREIISQVGSSSLDLRPRCDRTTSQQFSIVRFSSSDAAVFEQFRSALLSVSDSSSRVSRLTEKNEAKTGSSSPVLVVVSASAHGNGSYSPQQQLRLRAKSHVHSGLLRRASFA
jgi:hypothetical protein